MSIMDPCPFVRLVVSNLTLKIPIPAKPIRTLIHPSSSPCFCKIHLKTFPVQISSLHLLSSDIPPNTNTNSNTNTVAATFHLNKSDLAALATNSIFSGKLCLKVFVYTGRLGDTCGVSSGRLLGKVRVPLDLGGCETRPVIFHDGWVSIGKGSKTEFHLNVRSDPDPRFVFQFDGEPECSPQVFQIQGNIRQPVFTCNFSFRSMGDRNHRSRSQQTDTGGSRTWLSSFGSDRSHSKNDRKGWSVTVHDLLGSPVAAASMVTPFVASPGSDRVSRSNPGSWLILRPTDGTWTPWGRLEAWRERGPTDRLGYKFELIPDTAGAGVVLTESSIDTCKGGKFVIDLGASSRSGRSSSNSPACSPKSGNLYRGGGFVMGARVEGEGKCSKPSVEVGVHHVCCTEDAATFVAMAAAVDLSMDACKLFSSKLRKELCQVFN